MKKYESYYNLPNKVTFCKKCVLSNQRPASVPELKHTRNRDGAKYLNIDKSGVCDACNYHVNKAPMGLYLHYFWFYQNDGSINMEKI